ncbi:hypothetical protein QBC45DRAFT_328143, partial [Copromyces sp. CBS 386.78]
PYFNNIYIKGPRIDYNREEINIKGVRKYVLEYLINIDKILFNVELAGGIIVITKSNWC